MLSIHEINKYSKKRVLLIHGLFASSGFWLPYIDKLKGINLLILNIDYDQVIGCSQKANILFQKILEIQDVDAIIAHSLGTKISSHIQLDIPRINICPIHDAKKINQMEFVSLISEKAGMNYNQVNATINHMDNFSINTKCLASNKNVFNFYPNNDKFFEYSIKKLQNNILFTGDHFDILDAFNKLKIMNFII